MVKMLLNGGKIFDGERFFDGDILIENGEIAGIGTVSTTDAMVYDVSDCIISTGLIDIHTHLSEMGNNSFGFPADMATIPFGVTYAVDACTEWADVKILEKLCAKTLLFIPARLKGGALNCEEIEKKLSFYGDRAIGLKVCFDEQANNGITYEILRFICEFAHKKNVKVMVHCSYSATPMIDIVELLNEGDILTHCYHGSYHTIDENDYIAYKKAKEKGVIIDAGMAGGVHTDFAVLKQALTRGYFPDTISSDITKVSAYMRGGIYGLPMCMSIMKTLGMEERKIFKAVTKNAATAIGKKEWAQMQVGVPATLSVLKWEDTNIDITDKAGNSVVSEKGYICKMTVKDGKILYRN